MASIMRADPGRAKGIRRTRDKIASSHDHGPLGAPGATGRDSEIPKSRAVAHVPVKKFRYGTIYRRKKTRGLGRIGVF
jgi:hypothetical protein